MIIERTESPQWTSNAYLVADKPGGRAILIDGNGVPEPLLAKAKQLDVTIEAVIITHRHADHIAGVDEYLKQWDVPVLAHPITKDAIAGSLSVNRTFVDGDALEFGDLRVAVLETPGHTAGQVSLLVNGSDVFTADVLFKGTVGGTFAPGNTGYADQHASVMRLMELPPETVVHPGHTLPTTIGDELEHNPFVRIWRGLDDEGTEQVKAMGRDATLVLWAPDYDGSNKAWVRFSDDGADGIVGGSQIER